MAVALGKLAQRLLAKHSPKIVAVTGSVGKTSTKRAIAAAVETTYKTQWHEGNYNTDIGLPFAVFEIQAPTNVNNPFSWLKVLYQALSKLWFWDYPYELLILEYGIDKVGEMDSYINFAAPDIGVVTAVQGAHLEGLGSVDTVYEEKIKLAYGSDVALINKDDENLKKRYLKNHKDAKTYGFSASNYRITKVTRRKSGQLSCTIGGHRLTTNFVVKHQLSALAAGWAVGSMLEVDESIMKQGLEELEPFPGRMNLLRGRNNSKILDDTYNNVSVQAAESAIQALADFPAKRHMLVFGTMNEMGETTEEGHKQVAKFATKQELDYVITIGDIARDVFAKEMVAQGFERENIVSFLSPYDAGHHLSRKLKKDDVVLVKGSQNRVFAEEATALLLELESDRSKLVRQSSFWQKKKHSQFNQ